MTTSDHTTQEESKTVTTMKAARMHDYGGPEVLKVDQVPMPTCGPKDVLIEVHASAVNPIDWKIRKGINRAVIRKNLPATLGMDVSGVVTQVGSKVTRFKVGDEVFSSPSHKREGTYAEYVVIEADQVAPKPSNLTHQEAASIPLVGLTAWNCLVDAAQLQKGEHVFIEAGAGGVGTFAIQLAKHLGATVSTTCSPRNEGFVRELGADHVVDYRSERFEEVLPPQDVVLEAMGGDSKERALKILKPGGRLTSINSDMSNLTKKHGPNIGVLAVAARLINITVSSRLCHKVRFHSVIRTPDGQNLAKIGQLLEQGAIKPLIDRVFPLDQIADAHRYSEEGHARGKIIIQVR